MKILDIEQGTPEWFEVRLGKLTASSAQAIAANGAGLKTLVFEKVAERLTGKIKEQYTNGDIERGEEWERLARDVYELKTGKKVTQVGFVELSEFVGCSPDGLVEDDGLIEIKCKNDANFVRFMFDKKIDPAHFWQMQMQMFITDRKWCDYMVYNENFNDAGIIVRVERDEKAIDKIKSGLDSGVKMITEILDKVNG